MTHLEFTRGDWEDIGDGISIRRVFREGVLHALDWQHGCASPCDDYIPLDNPADSDRNVIHSWKLESENPLTISPSLLCTDSRCRRHGFIRNGKWESA